MAPIPVYVASYSTRAYTEVCVRSLHRFADAPFELVVGDSGSEDGSAEMLEALAADGWLRLERSATPLVHSQWLDRWIATAEEPYVVFCDSDVEFLRGCLADMRRTAERTDATIVSPRLVPGGPYRDDRLTTRVMPRPAPWLMMVHAARVRALSTSYEVVTEPAPEYPEAKRTFDVGALLYQRAVARGMSHVSMGRRFARTFRHYENASWGEARPVGRLRRRSAAEVLETSLRRLRIIQPSPSRFAVAPPRRG